MRTEKEILDMFKNAKLDSFKLNTEFNETNTMELMTIEDLIEFSCKHKIDTMFYNYTFIDEDVLSITDELILLLPKLSAKEFPSCMTVYRCVNIKPK